MQCIVRSDHHDRTDEGEGEGEGEGDASTGAESGRRATVSDMEDAKAQAAATTQDQMLSPICIYHLEDATGVITAPTHIDV